MGLTAAGSKSLRPFIYGVSDLGPASIDIFLKVYLLLYFNIILGLSPSLTSLAIGLGVLWDALIDPWIGVYSDRYYHRQGHRKGIIYVATIAVTVLFFVLWRIPPGTSEIFLFTFLFVVSSLLNSAISLYSVPYMALANDLESDNEKRKVWTAWRLAFLNLGAFVGLSVPAYFLTRDTATAGDLAAPYKISSAILCVTMMVCSFTTILYVYRGEQFKPKTLPKEKQKTIRELVTDKKFLRLMVSYFVVNCGIGLNSALALYYYKDYLQFSEKQTQTILVGFLTVFTFSIPLWVYLTRKIDKAKLISYGAFIFGLMTVICFPNFRGIDFWTIFTLAAGLGGVLVGVAVVLEIYLSDFLQEKEIETAQNVSGQYLGIWKMSAKISRAVAIALAGPILEIAGDKQVLANYFGWGVGLFLMAGALIMLIPIKQNEST